MPFVIQFSHYTIKLEESVRDNLEGGREVEDEREDAVLIDLRTLWPTGQEDDDPLQQQSASSSGETVEEASMAEEARIGRSSIENVMSKKSKVDYAIYTLGCGEHDTKV